jgi:predicted  nucleic acid-binding Zn-ribbon protein
MTSYIEAVEKLIDQNNKLPTRIQELEARNKELTLQLLATSGQAADALDKLTKAVEDAEKWRYAFAAQSRKLQAVLYIEGVKAVLAELEGK